ncbi:NUDIX hydrolase [Paractinoplanes rishiriensis]|uniref:NUDIX hydrolase n=1 Tax=Paractinoplanes rishiriensis TaxID=1050105 RepID=UPI003F68C0D2
MIDKVAWIRIDGGRILSTRSRGRCLYYLPGGKREKGEDDLQTLAREIREELSVDLQVGSARLTRSFLTACGTLGSFDPIIARGDGRPA